MRKLPIYATIGFALLGQSPSASALEQIIHPYQSVRSAGMGGVFLTTGLYEENFFGNPARVTANPKFRVTVLDPTVEINSNIVSNLGDISKSGDTLSNIGKTAGTNNHARVELTTPAVYFPKNQDSKMAYAFAMITSAQGDVDLRQSYQAAPQAVIDIGPALTVGRAFLADDALSAGITPHFTYRMSSRPGYSFLDYVQGVSLSPAKSGGDGSMIDFDLGSTYHLPWQYEDFDFSVGAAINNLLGGNYNNLRVSYLNTGLLPLAQPRTLGFGGSAHTNELWVFKEVVFALDIQDIGNNPDGSLFRTVHLGGEGHYGILSPRLGINQGYWSAGLGFDFRFVTLDLATYGEEMSLNMGQIEDRRYALRLAFQI